MTEQRMNYRQKSMLRSLLRLLITLPPVYCLILVSFSFSSFGQETSESEPDPVPEQINLDGLSTLEAYYRAIEELSIMPEDMPIEIPIEGIPGVQGTSFDENSEAAVYVIGFVDSSGQPRSITPSLLVLMLEADIENPGSISGNLNSLRVPVIDLIVRRSDGNHFVIGRVNAIAFARNVVNAVLSNTWRRRDEIWNTQN